MPSLFPFLWKPERKQAKKADEEAVRARMAEEKRKFAQFLSHIPNNRHQRDNLQHLLETLDLSAVHITLQDALHSPWAFAKMTKLSEMVFIFVK